MFKHCSETEKVDLHYFYEMLIWSISHLSIQNRPFFCSCLKRNGFTYVNIGRLVLGEAKELTGKWCLVFYTSPCASCLPLWEKPENDVIRSWFLQLKKKITRDHFLKKTAHLCMKTRLFLVTLKNCMRCSINL